jgi:hypothetical protein
MRAFGSGLRAAFLSALALSGSLACGSSGPNGVSSEVETTQQVDEALESSPPNAEAAPKQGGANVAAHGNPRVPTSPRPYCNAMTTDGGCAYIH